jgi:hypothetical protein
MSQLRKKFMAISTNSLFHFTDKIEIVLNILREGFKPHFCLEDINPLGTHLEPEEMFEYAIPMVCFCDIPLTQTKDHMSKYGDYGIGLSKDWGMRNKISPILYAHKNSEIMYTIEQVALEVLSLKCDKGVVCGIKDIVESAINWTNYLIKPYEGKMWRRVNYVENIHFYDEREWRYVPRLSENGYKYVMTKEKFLDQLQRNDANRKLWPQTVLNFEQKDINCIIISCEDEIPHFIEEMEQIDKYSKDEIKLLFTRVISAERIRKDF